LTKIDFLKGFRGAYKGFFGSNEDNKEIKSFLKNIIEPEKKIEVGKAVELDYRKIYPIIEIIIIKNAKNAPLFAEIYPVALIIEEEDQKFVINLTEDVIDSEKFIEMI